MLAVKPWAKKVSGLSSILLKNNLKPILGKRWISRSNTVKSHWPSLPVHKFDIPRGTLQLTVPGMCRPTIDRAGYPYIWQATEYFELGRINLYFHPAFEQLMKDGLVFILTARYRFSPAFFSPEVKYQTLDIHSGIVNLKNTSFAQDDRLVSASTGEEFCTAQLQLVTVDTQTRRPIPIPADIKDTITHQRSVPMERITGWDRPGNTHVYPYQLQWSDADFYNHTNHSTYIRICHDAANSVCMAGGLSRLRGDLAHQRVEVCECNYRGETVPGETVYVHVWEEDPLKLKFDIVSTSDKSVFQCSMKFAKPVAYVNVP